MSHKKKLHYTRRLPYSLLLFSVLAAALLSLFLSACTQKISKQQAEKNAVDFINTNVKFFAKNQEANSSTNISQA